MTKLRINFLNLLSKAIVGIFACGLSFSSFGQIIRDTISAAGLQTWTVPANVTNITLDVWGAGGGGGGAESHILNYSMPRAAGGGGGAFSSGSFAVTSSDVLSITVGAGGIGGTSTQDGTAGGATIVELAGTTIVSADGGQGGAYRDCEDNVGVATGLGGAGGVLFQYAGGNGAPSNTTELGAGGGGAGGSTQAGADGTGSTGGLGGLVGGGKGGDPTTLQDEDGKPGIIPGGGGSGARRTDLAGSTKGGDGANGRVIISYCLTPSAPTIATGSLTPCEQSNETYTLTADANIDHYVWTLPNGWSGLSTTNSIDVVVGQAGTITVEAFNACGQSTTETFTIDVTALPTQPSAITGNAMTCEGTQQTYAVTNDATVDSYTWTLPGDWTGTSTTNSIDATIGTQAGVISVVANNSCGSSTASILNATVSNLPDQPSAINGNTTFCQGDNAAFNVTSNPDVTTYVWTFPADWTGTSTTNVINLTAGATSGDVTVAAVNSCGSSTAQTLTITVNPVDATVTNNNNVLTANQAGAVYLWINCGTGAPVANGSGQTYTPVQNGSYKVMITTPSGCTVVSECVTVSNLSVEKATIEAVSVYPNPASNFVTIANVDGDATVQLLDMTGKVVISTVVNGTTKINLEEVNAGAYFLVVSTANGVKNQKLIVRK